MYSRFFRLICISLVSWLPLAAQADFGEVDLMVRESVENFFLSEGREVQMDSLSYDSQRFVGAAKKMLVIESSVEAEQSLTRSGWGTYRCSTSIEIVKPGTFVDRGTDCYLDMD